MPLQRRLNSLNQTAVSKLQRREVHRHCPILPSAVVPLAHLPTGLIEHPLADRDDQTAFFSERDEFVRLNETARRMLPTEQRLRANRRTVRRRDFRLVIED